MRNVLGTAHHNTTEIMEQTTSVVSYNQGDIGKAPMWLPKRAKILWKLIAEHYANKPILTELDRPALASLCLAAAKIEELERLIAACEDIDEEKVYVKLRKEYEATFRVYSGNFGLSPKERASLATAMREADIQLAEQEDPLLQALQI